MTRTCLSALQCLLLCLAIVACGSHKTIGNATDESSDSPFNATEFVQQVAANAHPLGSITAKLKFSAEAGGKQLSVSGSLKMKRDAVIRIQLMALGIMEAGRLEFTPDYVLIMDRINKQYVKAPYADVEFLKNSGISFYTLQSLFWNELFQPGNRQPELSHFTATRDGQEVIIRLDEDRHMDYSWVADRQTARIDATHVDHSHAQLAWNYGDFKPVGQRLFPTDMQATLATQRKTVKVGLQLSGLSDDSDWETLTKVSAKYHQVSANEILGKLLSL